MKKIAAILIMIISLVVTASAQKIYWGDSVPPGWNGTWQAKYLTVPEKTKYERTASSTELLEFVDVLRWNSDKVHAFSVYTSPQRRICPAVVLANPRVTTPDEAAKSGKTVVYLQGNIHPYEAEGKEALLMLMREIHRRETADSQRQGRGADQADQGGGRRVRHRPDRPGPRRWLQHGEA